jgi:hypothetical protein
MLTLLADNFVVEDRMSGGRCFREYNHTEQVRMANHNLVAIVIVELHCPSSYIHKVVKIHSNMRILILLGRRIKGCPRRGRIKLGYKIVLSLSDSRHRATG